MRSASSGNGKAIVAAKVVWMTFAQMAEKYLQWVKQNRAARFWARREKTLREDVLPVIGNLQCSAMMDTHFNSAIRLPLDQKAGLRAINAANAVIEWGLKEVPLASWKE